MRLIYIAVPAMLSALMISSAPINAAPANSVILAKAGQNPILIWDASQKIYTLISNGSNPVSINKELELEAVHVVDANIKALAATNGTLTVRIIYRKFTPNGTNYKVETIAGTTLYALLRLPIADAVKYSRVSAHRGDAKMLAGAQYIVVGPLPGN